MLKEVVFLACIASLIDANPFGSVQSAGAQGRLMCNGKPLAGALVKLYDDDTLRDDKLAEMRTDANGGFRLSGHTKEITRIDPKLNIYHHCGKMLPGCSRKITIEIPKSYITKGTVAEKYFDLGQMEMVGKLKGETSDCIH